ncbi:MAG: class I SAM-dependent methyltransferase [Candidatus Omnitrophota bacterium]|jgi:SAM-dependent methyltransferase
MTLSKNIVENCDLEEYHGIDISDSGVFEAKKIGINAVKINVDESVLPYDDSYFDFIFAGELIEHLFNPDLFLSESYRVLKSRGYLLLTTPNLASWHNRIALFLGYQPHYSEVSLKYNVGKMFPTDKGDVSGHIRLFTYRAIKELLNLYNFKIIKIMGQGTDLFIERFFSCHCPSFSSGLIILCYK